VNALILPTLNLSTITANIHQVKVLVCLCVCLNYWACKSHLCGTLCVKIICGFSGCGILLV